MTYKQDVETLREMVRASYAELDAAWEGFTPHTGRPSYYRLTKSGIDEADSDSLIEEMQAHKRRLYRIERRVKDARKAVVKYSPKPFLVDERPGWQIVLITVCIGISLLSSGILIGEWLGLSQ